jgi:hypothetical protein
MPGMNSEQMQAMDGSSEHNGHQFAATETCALVTRCAQIPESEVLEFLLPSAGAIHGKLLVARERHSVAANGMAEIALFAGPNLFLREARPPTTSPSDLFNPVLRI